MQCCRWMGMAGMWMLSVCANAGGLMQRDFWFPVYQGQRLAYCLADEKTCGLPVASRYCRRLGYQRATRDGIDYNVGLANYLSSQGQERCTGWRCHGFKLITCEGGVASYDMGAYLQPEKVFNMPRLSDYPVAWCHDIAQKECGYKAAYSFCRRMGYHKPVHFTSKPTAASRTLGDEALCFGRHCLAFKTITCRR